MQKKKNTQKYTQNQDNFKMNQAELKQQKLIEKKTNPLNNKRKRKIANAAT